MKKLLVMVAVMVVAATVAQASCTFAPVTIGKSYTTHDDGNGPNVQFAVDNVLYTNPTTTLTVAAGAHQIESDSEWGYVNIYAGFGGCYVDWSWEVIHFRNMQDLTTGTMVWSEPGQTSSFMHCGYVPSCKTPVITNPFAGQYHNVTLVSGHHYIIRDMMQALTNYMNIESGVYTTVMYVNAQ